MKTENKPTPEDFANMAPEQLLKRCANFKNYQILGECLDYNPLITASGSELPLNDWNYDEMTSDPECQKGLDRWTKSKQAAPEIVRQMRKAATPSWVWGEYLPYLEVLNELSEHLGLGRPPWKTWADYEQVIVRHLLQEALKKIESLSETEKAKFNEDLSAFLTKQGVDIGKQSPLSYLRAGGLAGAGTLAGTQIATGIILTHLGLVHAAMFAVGLWSVSTAMIGGIIFAPLMGGSVFYLLGKHNFKKTLPCVAIISTLRQEAMLRNP
jgi:hypothetical protein